MVAPELFVVDVPGFGVGLQQVMSAEIFSNSGGGNGGRLPRRTVALVAGLLWLVEGKPVLDVIAEQLETQSGVVGEPVDDEFTGPASCVVKRLRSVPMEDGHEGFDVIVLQFLYEVLVVLHSGEVHLVYKTCRNI